MQVRQIQINRKYSGQILVEVLVALSVLTMGFVGIFSLLNQSLALHRVVANNYVATYLAGEGVELIKSAVAENLISGSPWNSGLLDGTYEADYLGFLSPVGGSLRPLQYDTNLGVYSYNPGTTSQFQRSVAITAVSSQELRVISSVRWTTRGSAVSSVSVESYLYNWR